MRDYTREYIHVLIDDSIRMDCGLRDTCYKYRKDFVKESYKKHACNDVEQFIYARMGQSPRASGEFISRTLLEYADKAKFYANLAEANSIIFRIKYDVAMDLYDIVSHLC